MNIAIDTSPLKNKRSSQHKVRGSGFYIDHLTRQLLKVDKENKYFFFQDSEDPPKDISVIHYPYFEPFFLTLPLVRKSKRVIVTVHDLTPLVFKKEFPVGVKGKIKWQIQKKALQNVDAIITDSHKSKDDIIRLVDFPADLVFVIYLAAADSFTQIKNKLKINTVKIKYNLPNEFLLYVGDATWNKNIPRLIEASKKSDIPLVMVGKAVANNYFDKENIWNKDLVTMHKLIDGGTKFIRLGFIPTEDLAAIYNLATMFVMPSLYEGFGLPILEAMGSGCPVITSRSGSIPEIAGDAALYVDPYSANDIYSTIIRLYEDKNLRESLKERGLKQSQQFSWEKTALQTIKVYERKN